jgi:nicotinamidase-related amidase
MKRHPTLLTQDQAVLLIIDVQEGFRKYIPDLPAVTRNISILVESAKILQLPTIVTEQYPKGLGRTLAELQACLGDHQVFEKECFSCCGSDQFLAALRHLERRQIIVSGIEAHVCVHQTVHDLIECGFQPHLVVDAIASRNAKNKEVAVERMCAAGAVESVVEMALFEMLKNAGTETFKSVQRLLK